MSYLLTLRIKIDAADDPQARSRVGALLLGLPQEVEDAADVKLQKLRQGKPPRGVRMEPKGD